MTDLHWTRRSLEDVAETTVDLRRRALSFPRSFARGFVRGIDARMALAPSWLDHAHAFEFLWLGLAQERLDDRASGSSDLTLGDFEELRERTQRWLEDIAESGSHLNEDVAAFGSCVERAYAGADVPDTDLRPLLLLVPELLAEPRLLRSLDAGDLPDFYDPEASEAAALMAARLRRLRSGEPGCPTGACLADAVAAAAQRVLPIRNDPAAALAVMRVVAVPGEAPESAASMPTDLLLDWSGTYGDVDADAFLPYAVAVADAFVRTVGGRGTAEHVLTRIYRLDEMWDPIPGTTGSGPAPA